MARTPKLHRWLDLIAFLVGRRFPVSLDELVDAVPDYAKGWRSEEPKARQSVRRMFERDKDDLRRLGIPIESVDVSLEAEDRPGEVEPFHGYRLASRDFYLPYLRILGEATSGRPAEDGERRSPGSSPAGSFEVAEHEATAALDGLRHLAELPDFPLAREARSAYRKLTFDLDPRRFASPPALLLPGPGADDVRERMELLADAVLRRKRVTFRYRGIRRDEITERDVAPYGVSLVHGQWYLVGHDAPRDDLRRFRVSRMEEVEVNAARPHAPDFEVPADFRHEELSGRRAWELGGVDDATVTARVLFRFPTSLWAERNAHGTLVERRRDGSAVRSFELKDASPFLRWILSLEGEAEIQLPGELRQEVRRMAGAVADRHRETADG